MHENDFKIKTGMCTLITSELFDLEFYFEDQAGNSKKKCDSVPNIMGRTVYTVYIYRGI